MVRQAHRIAEQLRLRLRSEVGEFANEANKVTTPAAASASGKHQESTAVAGSEIVVNSQLLPDGVVEHRIFVVGTARMGDAFAAKF